MDAERSFVVATRTAAQEISCVADLAMGARGELVLKDAQGACCAIFAPGEWLHVIPAEGADDE